MLLFEEDLDGRIALLQPADPADAVQQVPGEARDALGDDHVDLSRHGVLHHELEGGPMLGDGPGKSAAGDTPTAS